MAAASRPLGNLPERPRFPVRRFTVAEYHRLGETGVLTEDDQVELLEGWIVPQMIHNPSHDAAIELAQRALQPRLPSGWRMRIQSAITTEDSEPEPDLAIVRGAIRDHVDRHPEPQEIALVIEIAESSLERDRRKARLYARAGIPTFWLVNLVDRRIEVYRDPVASGSRPRYRSRRSLGAGQRVPFVVAGRSVAEVPVDDLLP